MAERPEDKPSAQARSHLPFISCRTENFPDLQEAFLREIRIQTICKKNHCQRGNRFLQISEIPNFARSLSCGAPAEREGAEQDVTGEFAERQGAGDALAGRPENKPSAQARSHLSFISCRTENFPDLQEAFLREIRIQTICKKNHCQRGNRFLQISEIPDFARSLSYGAPRGELGSRARCYGGIRGEARSRGCLGGAPRTSRQRRCALTCFSLLPFRRRRC